MKKNTINKLVYFLLFFFLFNACSRDGFLVTESGLHYTIHESFGKKKPALGEIMYMHLVYRNSKDSILFDSRKLGDNFAIELMKPSFRGGLEEAFAMLGEGDSASFLIKADSLYEKVFHAARPAYINKGEKLLFQVRLLKIVPAVDYASQQKINKKKTAAEEDFDIRQYLARNNIFVKPLPDGMVYISFIEGKGKCPVAGDEVEVTYVGTFITGEMFDATSKESGPLKFKMGDGSMIDAWVEGLSLMKEGGKSRLVIPSRLAYGEKGFGPIKANSTIIYDVELVKVH